MPLAVVVAFKLPARAGQAFPAFRVTVGLRLLDRRAQLTEAAAAAAGLEMAQVTLAVLAGLAL
jgi:hypothetical protein